MELLVFQNILQKTEFGLIYTLGCVCEGEMKNVERKATNITIVLLFEVQINKVSAVGRLQSLVRFHPLFSMESVGPCAVGWKLGRGQEPSP